MSVGRINVRGKNIPVKMSVCYLTDHSNFIVLLLKLPNG